MQLVTTIGYFSITQVSDEFWDKKEFPVRPFQIRALRKNDMVRLLDLGNENSTEWYGSQRPEIVDTWDGKSDYPYRILIAHYQLENLFGRLPSLINYTSFLNSVTASGDEDLTDAVWAVKADWRKIQAR